MAGLDSFDHNWQIRLPMEKNRRVLAVLEHYQKRLPDRWVPQELIEDLVPHCKSALAKLKAEQVIWHRRQQQRGSARHVDVWCIRRKRRRQR